MGYGLLVLGLRFKVQSLRFCVQGLKFKVGIYNGNVETECLLCQADHN